MYFHKGITNNQWNNSYYSSGQTIKELVQVPICFEKYWIRMKHSQITILMSEYLLFKFALPSLTVYPKKYAHGFCFAVLCCGYILTDFPIIIRLTSLALWQSNDCPSASKATLMNMDKYFMWIHYERLRNHNKAKHNKTVCIFLGIYCTFKRHLQPFRYFLQLHSYSKLFHVV